MSDAVKIKIQYGTDNKSLLQKILVSTKILVPPSEKSDKKQKKSTVGRNLKISTLSNEKTVNKASRVNFVPEFEKCELNVTKI